MAKAPSISIRGLRAKSFPTGYLVGRQSHGKGDLELLSLGNLRQFGLASGGQVTRRTSAAGFGFNIEGLMLDAEALGSVSWPFDVTFQNGNVGTVVTCAVPATVDSTLIMTALDATNIPYQAGTMVFLAGASSATVAFTAGSFVNLAGKPLAITGPHPADVTLANLTGTVTGKK